MCGTSTSDIDVEYAEAKGVRVTFVEHYATQATVEYIFLELLSILRNQKNNSYDPQWHQELSSKTIGLVGVGDIGFQTAKIALAFGMKVKYLATCSKEELNSLGAKYCNLEEMIQTCDILSLHVPRNLFILDEGAFQLLEQESPCRVLVNTCLGRVMDEKCLLQWIQNRDDRFVIMDQGTSSIYQQQLKGQMRAIFFNEVAGKTFESRIRMGDKIAENLRNYFT